MLSDENNSSPIWIKKWLEVNNYSVDEAVLLVAGHDPDRYSGDFYAALDDRNCDSRELTAIMNKVKKSCKTNGFDGDMIKRDILIRWAAENGYPFPELADTSPTGNQPIYRDHDSTLLTLRLALDNFFEKNTHGGQAEAVRHISKLADEKLQRSQGLSEPNLKKMLKAADDIYRERKR